MSSERTMRRVTLAFAIAGAASLLLGFLIAVFGDPAAPSISAGNDSFSRSALGHRLFVELLRQRGQRVVTGRWNSADLANQREAPLVVIEPDLAVVELRALLDAADTALLVLPKRSGDAGGNRGAFVHSSELLPLDVAERVLAVVAPGAKVERGNAVPLERYPGPPTSHRERVTPDVADLQTIHSDAIEPIFGTADATLLGMLRDPTDRTLFVLADPDLLATHGIVRGENAAIALDIAASVAAGATTLVVDETCHGHEVEPRIWSALGRYPLSLALFQALAVIATLLWIGLRRLGAPVPAAPALAPGRLTLVATTAELLLAANRSGPVLLRYLRNAEHEVARALALAGATDETRREALARIEVRRRPTTRLEQVAETVNAAMQDPGRPASSLLGAARTVHRWRTEMLHGTR